MNRFSKISVGLSAAALAIAGAACAQSPAAPPGGSERDRPEARTQTRAEAQARAEAMFARLDVNKDGKLDRADREARRQERRSALFDRLDADKDGAISKVEFMADRGPDSDRGRDRGSPHPEGDMPPPPGGPEASGDRPSPDHAERHRRHGGPRGDMKRRMPGFGKADDNRDRSITRSEFVAAALQRFDAIDTDKDGKVTPQERRAAHDRMRAEWQARKGERGRTPEGAEPKAPPPAQK